MALLVERDPADDPMRAAIRRLIARRLLDCCPALGLAEARQWAMFELERVERGVELGEVDKRLLLAAAERLMAEEAAGLGGAA